jgi:hypothetical protein
VVLDVAAEGNALVLGNFLKADERGDQQGIIEGQIGRKLGANWYLDENMPTHATHSLSHTTSLLTNGTAAVGAATVVVDRATLTGNLKTGDLLSFSGINQQYVVTATVTASTNAITIGVSPTIATAITDGLTVTVVSGHIPNLYFHKKAFAMAVRPLAVQRFEELGNFASVVDPVSRLVVRLEISREHKQTTLSWDILYGRASIRPTWASRILG